jgi:uncharacterized repeat protein (TIGR03803 family)
MTPHFSKSMARLMGGTALSLVLAATGAHATPAEKVLHNFDVVVGGYNPQASLTPGPGGIYYGTADNGGATNNGCVFALIPPAAGQTNWTEKVIYSFSGAPDGASPSSGLLLSQTGTLYGVTGAGGAQGAGVVFSLTPPADGTGSWTESVLYTFTGGADGKAPFGTLVSDANGVLYGSTAGGGNAMGAGVVFSLAPPAAGSGAWTETVLHEFQGNADGASPGAGVLRDDTGALYGVTSVGGVSNGGTVYRLTPPTAGSASWAKATLYNFTGQADGGYPVGGLVLNDTGILYGVTAAGGVSGAGTAFALKPPATGKAWTESVLYSFSGGLDGASPGATPVLGSDGTLYGTSSGGGTAGSGTVFALTPPAAGKKAWTEAALASFTGPNGSAPVGLGLTAGGGLIGTTIYGGIARKGGGTVFLLTPPQAGATAWTQAELLQFNEGGPDGASPVGALLTSKSGVVYGTTSSGGAYHQGAVVALTPPAAGGTVWKETVLFSFNGNNGSFPNGGLVEGANGVLYGTTADGGPQKDGANGTVFSLTPPAAGQSAWTEALLHVFKGARAGDGANPGSGVILGAGGALFGTTGNGGIATADNSDGNGIVFKLIPPPSGKVNWIEKIIHSFTGADGSTPDGTLLATRTGVLYGTTYNGGSASDGTVFSLTPPATPGGAWTEAVLHSFNPSVGNDGAIPGAEQLVQDSSGALYGTASQGGVNNDGVVFKLAPPAAGATAWTETLIHNFAGADGIAPFVGLLAGTNGVFYGVAAQGGDLSSCPSPFGGGGCGTVFKLTPPASGTAYIATVLHTFEPLYGRDVSDPGGALTKYGLGTYLGTAATGGLGGGGGVFQITP